MNEWMIFGTGVATGILLMAIWHWLHVWLSNRDDIIGLRRKMAKVAPWDKDSVCCAHNVKHCAVCQEIRNQLVL